jgi:hypothetical protein
MGPPSPELTQFALWALEQTLDRVGDSGQPTAPVIWYLSEGKQLAAIFDESAPIDACRAQVAQLDGPIERYALVYAATHVADGAEHEALVAEAGDAAEEYRFGVVHATKQIIVSHLGPSRRA